jgi:hypothetical protein
MPHLFSDKIGGHPISVHEGCKGVAQRVKVRITALLILVHDAVGLSVLLQPAIARDALRKHQTR